MRYAKALRILGMALILSLLVIAIPAAPAQAAREIIISPDEGNIGDEGLVCFDNFIADQRRESPGVSVRH